MKKILLILLLFLFNSTSAQINIPENKKIESLVRVWGLLKYHHPEVSRGKFDINKKFLEMLTTLENINSRQEFNYALYNWVKNFGEEDLKPNKEWKKRDQLFDKNFDYSWISNSYFDNKLKLILQKIQYNTNFKDYYASVNHWSSAVEFHDLPLKDFESGSQKHRLLFLAHFWNAMKYWNVNIHLTSTPWSDVLSKMIPEFKKEEEFHFEIAKEKLFSSLNDSHSNYYKSKTLNNLAFYPNFGGRLVNDSLVITRFFDEKQVKDDGLSLGDVIFSVEGENLKDLYTRKFKNAISASNNNHLKKTLENTFLLASDKDSIKVGVYKSGGAKEEYIGLSKLEHWSERYKRSQVPKTKSIKFISDDDIGYINLAYITENELKKAFEVFHNTQGLVIDLRNYPRNISAHSFSKYLFPNKKQFVKVLSPSLPSLAEYDTKAALRFLKNPFKVGRKNQNYYKGKVILLVDRKTLSKAEWIGMAIQASPNVITIGEQTGGAVLNRNEILLMNNTSIDFTKGGAFYPDNEEVQGKGLRIDHVLKENALGYDQNLYLDTAVELILESQ